MGDIIPFDKPKDGDYQFPICPCNENTPWMYVPITIKNNEDSVIVAIVCPNCDASIDVVNGVIQK